MCIFSLFNILLSDHLNIAQLLALKDIFKSCFFSLWAKIYKGSTAEHFITLHISEHFGSEVRFLKSYRMSVEDTEVMHLFKLSFFRLAAVLQLLSLNPFPHFSFCSTASSKSTSAQKILSSFQDRFTLSIKSHSLSPGADLFFAIRGFYQWSPGTDSVLRSFSSHLCLVSILSPSTVNWKHISTPQLLQCRTANWCQWSSNQLGNPSVTGVPDVFVSVECLGIHLSMSET